MSIDFMRSLFCNHSYEFKRNIHGDEIVFSGYMRSVSVCTKCGKVRYDPHFVDYVFVPENKWEIKERLSDEELINQKNEIANWYVGKFYRHRNGDVYIVLDVTAINISGKSYWGFVYTKTLNRSLFTFCHTRPIYEFLDGRFTIEEGI